MGGVLGIESAPSQVEMDNAALYPDEVLQALRACFDALAVGGVIEAARFKPPMLPAEGAQWSGLYQLMSQLDEPSSSDGPLHWPGFLAGVTAYCKAFKSQRAKTMARGYAGGGTGLSDDALRLLLRHALVAARAGSDGGDGGGDGAALSPEWSFDGVLTDVSRGSGTGTLSAEAWTKWVGLNLPALPACMEAFVLETLCTIGRQRSAGQSMAGQGGAGQGQPHPGSRTAPLRALRVFEPPLLEMAKGQSRAVLDDAAAWLLGMAIGPNQAASKHLLLTTWSYFLACLPACLLTYVLYQAADARAWRCLFASDVHGLSMNRFTHHASGYAGPTLVLARTEAGEVFGGYVDAPWKAGTKYFGGQDCFLFTLSPAFHVYRATATASNYAFFNPPKTGQLQSSRYGAEQLPETFGFGGAPIRQRLGFDDDLNQLVWHSSDTSFAVHPAGPGDLPEGPRRVVALEVWGCGGADAEAARQLLKERAARDTARAAKVDRAVMFGGINDWRDGNNPDKMILEAAGAHTFYSDTLEKLPAEPSKR